MLVYYLAVAVVMILGAYFYIYPCILKLRYKHQIDGITHHIKILEKRRRYWGSQIGYLLVAGDNAENEYMRMSFYEDELDRYSNILYYTLKKYIG